MYYTCAGTLERREGVRTRICLATSEDGIEFTLHPASPVLEGGPPGAWDSLQVETVFVLVDGDEFKMYYNGYNTEDPDEFLTDNTKHMGAIGLAVSHRVENRSFTKSRKRESRRRPFRCLFRPYNGYPPGFLRGYE